MAFSTDLTKVGQQHRGKVKTIGEAHTEASRKRGKKPGTYQTATDADAQESTERSAQLT